MRLRLSLGLTAAGLLAVGLWAKPYILFYQMTGSFVPIHIIEPLNHPMMVTGWTAEGLQLADGRTLPIPGVRNLPKDSNSLIELTKRGIEIDPDGQMICLTRIWHWCGNDPVREHIVRVNLTDACQYLQIGEFPSVHLRDNIDFPAHTDPISEYGWNISGYYTFSAWRELKSNL